MFKLAWQGIFPFLYLMQLIYHGHELFVMLSLSLMKFFLTTGEILISFLYLKLDKVNFLPCLFVVTNLCSLLNFLIFVFQIVNLFSGSHNLERISSLKSSSFSSSPGSYLAFMLSLLSSPSLMGYGFPSRFPSFSWLENIISIPFEWRSWILSHMNFPKEHFSKFSFIESGSPFNIYFISLVLFSLDSPSIILLTITNFQTSMPWLFKKFIIPSSDISKFPLKNGAFTNWLTSITVVERDTRIGYFLHWLHHLCSNDQHSMLGPYTTSLMPYCY